MKILCKLNLFDLSQNIHIINDEGKSQVVKSTLENLSEDISKICNDNTEWEIDLYGEDKYIEDKIIPEVMDYVLAKYSKADNIKFEVNKK